MAKKGKQRSTKHIHKTKDRAKRTLLKHMSKLVANVHMTVH